MFFKKKATVEYNEGYLAALEKIEGIVTGYEKQLGRSIPEFKVLKEVLCAIFFIKLGMNSKD